MYKVAESSTPSLMGYRCLEQTNSMLDRCVCAAQCQQEQGGAPAGRPQSARGIPRVIRENQRDAGGQFLGVFYVQELIGAVHAFECWPGARR